MWLGACVSTIGTFVQQFAQSWLVYDLTRDPFYLGLDLFLGQLPIMLFSLFGGVFADRLDRKKMLLSSQYIQMICAFALTALFATHTVRVWHILSLSFLVGVGQSFGGPAYSALLPTLVEPQDLANAISMNSIQFNLARIIGPTLGGLVYRLRSNLVFRIEWLLLRCSDLFSVRYQGAVCRAEDTNVRLEKHEGRNWIYSRSGRFDSARRAGVLHNSVWFFFDWISPGDSADDLPQRPRDL